MAAAENGVVGVGASGSDGWECWRWRGSPAAALGWHGYCSGALLLGLFLVTALLACVVTLPWVALETAGGK